MFKELYRRSLKYDLIMEGVPENKTVADIKLEIISHKKGN
jgi:hypothetical protein